MGGGGPHGGSGREGVVKSTTRFVNGSVFVFKDTSSLVCYDIAHALPMMVLARTAGKFYHHHHAVASLVAP